MHQTVEVPQLNSIDTISQITLDFNQFTEANYAILESGFWPELHKLFDEFGLTYYFVGLNVFKNKNICPILIDLNKISFDKKKMIWDDLISITTHSYFSEFDKIYLLQNLIETKLNFDEFSLFLDSIISFNKKNVFRVYDPRVALHLAAVFPNFLNLSNKIERWSISINGGWYRLNLSKKNNFKINLSDVEIINEKLRYEVDNSVLDVNLILSKIYGEYDV